MKKIALGLGRCKQLYNRIINNNYTQYYHNICDYINYHYGSLSAVKSHNGCVCLTGEYSHRMDYAFIQLHSFEKTSYPTPQLIFELSV